MDFIDVVITKPLSGSYCCINESVLNRAIRFKKKIKVSLPTHSAMMDPKEWKKGKRMEKIFKRPDEPMILYCNSVPKPVKEVVQPAAEQNKLF